MDLPQIQSLVLEGGKDVFSKPEATRRKCLLEVEQAYGYATQSFPSSAVPVYLPLCTHFASSQEARTSWDPPIHYKCIFRQKLPKGTSQRMAG